MKVHFEDWSDQITLGMLPEGFPNVGKIIKAFATDLDPRETLDRPSLVVVESNDDVFDKDEAFEYPGRGVYVGNELEVKLAELELGDIGVRSLRALFRFSNQEGFCDAAMAATNSSGWLIEHPFGSVDWQDRAKQRPRRAEKIHLDVIFPESIKALGRTVDIEDPIQLLTRSEGTLLRRPQRQT